MLSKLYIANYVLINELEVDFTSGFTAITGETGAGKSIILGALSLILGDRADIARKGNPDKKIIAEGEFDIQAYQLKSFFEENELDYEPELTRLRREIVPSGKSRAFINDTPVTLSVLKRLGEQLVDIHSQHENQQLLHSGYQLDFLDSFCSNQSKRIAYAELYSEYLSLTGELDELIEREKKARQEEDYIRFQLNELEEANLNELDIDGLQAELDVLDHADSIRMGLQGAGHYLGEADQNVLDHLKEAIQQLQSIAHLNENLEELLNRLNSAQIEIDDIRSELNYQESQIESNPEKAAVIRSQIDSVNHLMHKHGLQENSELMQLMEDLSNRLGELDGFTERISELEIRISDVKANLLKKAKELGESRRKGAPDLMKKINDGLKSLQMPNAHVVFELAKTEDFTPTGMDSIILKFSANKGFEPQPLGQVASGGERSRLMLVLKRIHASVGQIPTLILDEIDTGISGEVAAKTADMLADMGNDGQIISITHLPQVAGKANTHLQVSKSTQGDTTETQLRVLSEEERTIEIARMLSGENISDAALENARTLMR